MHFKDRKINERNYRYIVKTIRLPNSKVVTLEKIHKGETKKELEKIFEEKEIKENTRYMLKNYKTDHIYTKKEFAKIEFIKFNYRRIQKKLTQTSKKDLLDKFTANFTYESNALEGN